MAGGSLVSAAVSSKQQQRLRVQSFEKARKKGRGLSSI